MKPFLASRRKMIDIAIMLVLNLIFYFLWQSFDVVALFSLGYIWNWVGSQDLAYMFENKRYRFSMLKVVFNLQHLFLKPFKKFPQWFQVIVRTLPAGIFWSMVIFFNDSEMPWWMTFIGSIVYELTQMDALIFKKQKEIIP
jgi:hypothetical protein